MPARIRSVNPDILLSCMVLIWGFHFIVIKDAFTNLDPMTFNTLRFLAGLPLIIGIGIRQGGIFAISRRDVGWLALTTLIGSLLYQILFVLGLDRTTATNSALLVATMPVWTALFSLAMGLTSLRRQLLGGIGMALGGVALVVLGRGGANLALSHDDLIGSGLVLSAAMINGVSAVLSKPVVDRVGGMRAAVWKYGLMTGALLVITAPNLAALSPDEFPVKSLPHLLYSGVLSGVGGFVATNYGLTRLGPTRMASYFNFNPIVAAFAGILVLGEPVNLGLVIGGPLTLWGVLTVRRNTFLRPSGQARSPGRA
ncbi:MAG: DMT family transporter [Anaerolineae bacterium]|nr:DMT family transporter [Anaerolineae bacterium]